MDLNCAFVTRHAQPELYQESKRRYEDFPYDKIALKDTTAQSYMWEMIKLPYDWIINIDDDAFLTDCQALLRLINYMYQHDYDYCGMADGGEDEVRIHSPATMNAFFNIFHVKKIWEKFGGQLTPDILHFRKSLTPAMMKKIPAKYHQFKPYFRSFTANGEPYYGFYLNLLDKCNPLYLECDKLKDTKMSICPRGKTTILKDPTNQNSYFLYHTWYGRRINNTKFEDADRIRAVMTELPEPIPPKLQEFTLDGSLLPPTIQVYPFAELSSCDFKFWEGKKIP